MKKIGFFFCGFFTVLLLSLVLFGLVVNYCGRGVTDQPWFLELYPLKTHVAREVKSPKIIIIGGSSSLFGINGEKLQEYTGMDNVNFSMSIMVPMRFYLAELEQYVQKGDVIVLPLELSNHYLETEEELFSNFGISLLLGCHHTTQKTLTPAELCSLYFQYGYSWVNTSLFHPDGTLRRLYRGERKKQGVFDGVYREKYVVRRRLQAQTQKGKMGYYSDLSRHGDWLIDQPGRPQLNQPYPLPADVSGEFVSTYNRIRTLAERRGATVLLVWPNNYYYAEQSNFGRFQKMLAAKGIVIHGRPEAVAFPKSFYHDPPHHMNLHGAGLWTYELAKTICQATGKPLQKRNDKWPYVVFADAPGTCFPGAKNLSTYVTGVQVGEREFPLVLDIPETLLGKALEVSLIVKPASSASPVFTSITAEGKACAVQEYRYGERAELTVTIPTGGIRGSQLRLHCCINGEMIGMERAFMQKSLYGDAEDRQVFHAAQDSALFSFGSGFSVMENWGCWTDGTRAEFALFIPLRLRGKEIELQFSAHTFTNPPHKPTCSFRILSRNREFLKMQSKDFDTVFTLRVPAELNNADRLPLTIEIADPASSQNDSRRLGVGIQSVTLKEVESVPVQK